MSRKAKSTKPKAASKKCFDHTAYGTKDFPTLREMIAQDLRKACPTDQIEEDAHSDESGSWIEIKRGDRCISIQFDYHGTTITGINAFEDVWEVVNSKMII